ncbi:MAG TPA: hypothetical protein VGG97_21405 [Bryobacteraceae bacterium]|jgi:hypothetical protein
MKQILTAIEQDEKAAESALTKTLAERIEGNESEFDAATLFTTPEAHPITLNEAIRKNKNAIFLGRMCVSLMLLPERRKRNRAALGVHSP